MVILTKKTKYDSILEGVHTLVNESVYGDLKKIGNSKKFTELKSFKVKSGVNLISKKDFDVNSSLSEVVKDVCTVALQKVLLNNSQLDKKIDKITNSAKGFSSVSGFLTV